MIFVILLQGKKAQNPTINQSINTKNTEGGRRESFEEWYELIVELFITLKITLF